MATSQDTQTEASMRSMGTGRQSQDNQVVYVDENDKKDSDTARKLRLTLLESGKTTYSKMSLTKRPDGTEEWVPKDVIRIFRSSVLGTGNSSIASDAEKSRQPEFVLPKVNTGPNQERRDAVPLEDIKEAEAGIQRVLLASAGNFAVWEHFGFANAPWNRLTTQVFLMMIRGERFSYGPRQLKRVESFAIGTQVRLSCTLLSPPSVISPCRQLLLLDMYLNRLSIWEDGELTEELKVVIYIMNRFANPQGLCIGASLYNTLGDSKPHFRHFMAAVKMLVDVKGGGVTKQNNYVKLTVEGASKRDSPVDTLIKRVDRMARDYGHHLGKQQGNHCCCFHGLTCPQGGKS